MANEFYLSRFILGDYFQPDVNISWGDEMTPKDMSKTDTSLGGVMHSDIGEKVYKLKFELAYLTDRERRTQLAKMMEAVGTSRPLIIQMEPGEQKSEKLSTYYGRFTQDPAIARNYIDQNQTRFVFQEEV